ncbi:MAG TPA: MFS transporter [Actinomycetota bacterium]|nr:MFS transporter [Actinomycetota bacterium]
MAAREPIETEGGLRASLSLLRRNRDFRRLYLASVISLGGDWFLLIALFGLMLDLTGQAIAVAFTIAAQDLTYFLASPFAGVLADRIDRRRMMIACDLARAVLVLGFLFVRTEDLAWLVYVLLAATAVFSAAFEPASLAATPNLVDERDLSLANALSGSLWGTMLAVGGALGGVVAGVFGSDVAIVVDSASFVLSAALIVGIRATFAEARTIHEVPSLREDTIETVRYARKDHRVLALLAVKFGWGVAGGVLVLLPILALGAFHAGEIGLGLLMAARGVGALIGPFIGRSLAGPQDRRLFGAIGGALATFGVGYALLGLAPALGFAMGAVLIAHVGGGAQWTLSSYGLQRVVPDRIRGRIFAVDGMLVTLTFGLSAILTGWLADALGAKATALTMGGIALTWAIAWTALTGDVRRATMLEGCGPAPEPDLEPVELPNP